MPPNEFGPLRFDVLESMLNRALAADPDAAARLAGLAGKTIAFESFALTDWRVALTFDDGRVRLERPLGREPDVTISGGPFSLLGSALAPLDRAPFGDGRVTVSGDETLALALSESIAHYEPDWQEPVSAVLGDPLTWWLERALASLREWSREMRRKLERDLGDYLREERRALASEVAVERFVEGVDELVADLDRLERRIGKLERGTGAPGDGR